MLNVRKKTYVLMLVFVFTVAALFAFDAGWVLNMRGNVGGSATLPSISDADLKKLGANKMTGMTGFIGGGVAEVGYIFPSSVSFKLPENHWFSAAGVFGRIGVTQGYAGQVSGSLVDGKQVDVFVNIQYTPVITFAAAGKAYFFKNRMAVGFSAGGKLIADTAPVFEMYSTLPETIKQEVGTIIVDDWMMKNMNPLMGAMELFAEYNVRIVDTMELILGGYTAFNIYTPKYITMPKTVMDLAITNSHFNPKEPLKSYFINSFDFGLTFGLGFRL